MLKKPRIKKLRKKSTSRTAQKHNNSETNSAYFLKITLFLILGSQWIYIVSASGWRIPVPVGLILGLVFANHDHFIIDRKIEYVLLIVATFISFWLPLGMIIQL